MLPACKYGRGSFFQEPVALDRGLPHRQRAAICRGGSIFIAGAVSQWLRDSLQLIDKASETEDLAKQAGGNEGVYFVLAFTGLGARIGTQKPVAACSV